MATKKISDLSLRSDFDDTVNLAGDDTSQTWRVTGAQIKAYIQANIADLLKSSNDMLNLGLQASVSGNALTVALKQLDGSTNPSSTSPTKIGFRGTTAGNGDSSLVSAVAATSVVVSSGSTLGMTSAAPATLYVYALNNAGTIELAISKKYFDDGSVQSTTAEGGAGAADSGTVLYSTTARTSKAIRLIGRLTVTEATAGTWASAPSEVSVAPFTASKSVSVQRLTSGSGTYTTAAGAKRLRVRMVGAGGGGGGSGTTSGTAAGDGADTTFGTSLLTAKGGSKGVRDGNGGAGGVAGTVAAPGTLVANFPGGQGGGNGDQGTSPVTGIAGGQGGGSYFAGGGGGGSTGGGGTGAGKDGSTNSGAGGGGASGARVTNASQGAGGGAGNYVEAWIDTPDATYAYVVGAGGAGQLAGTSGSAGGAGAAGIIIVEEFYQ